MQEYSELKGKTRIKRIVNATEYSLARFNSAYKHEAAFRHVVFMNLMLIPITFIVDISRVEQALMIAVCFLAIFVELFNSAIEAVVDRVSLEKHPLSKNAKDMGSAAQFFSLAIIFFTWLLILLPE